MIDVSSISSVHCTYPINKEDGETDNFRPPFQQPGQVKEIDFLLTNGERENLNITIPTVFRIVDEEGSYQTSDLQKFEKAYIRLVTEGIAEDNE